MPIQKWGAGRSEKPSIPMLADWLENNSVEADASFQVVKVSKSQQYGSYTLQCLTEASKGFRVNVYENKEEFQVLEENFRTWRDSNIAVFVVVVDTDWGHWTLGTDETHKCVWQKKGNGFTCEALMEPGTGTTSE